MSQIPEMTPRQRWLALLERKPVDRIPTDYTATPEVTARLLRELDCADERALWEKLHIDGRIEVAPTWKLPHHPDDPFADSWGVRYQRVEYGTGSYLEPCHHPLAGTMTVTDIQRYRWPEPADFDYTAVTAAVAAADGRYPIHGGWFEPFLFYAYMRGLEQAFEDLILEPQIATAMLGRLFEFSYEYHRHLFEAGCGKIDTMWVAEDLGSQSGPLMGLEMYRRFLLPNQIRMADLARSYGVHVMYHTDGAARIFIPDLIDKVGIEVLNPIQWRCAGMEREQLVRDFGSHIAFHGSIENQRILPFGTVAEVVAEVTESVRLYQDARWICAPCHRIQPVTPTANIVALYETIHEIG
jgi:uroporphyrinogen decarboxylase